MTFKKMTDEYDAIIKSKWKLMHEVDCLPDYRCALKGFVQRNQSKFESVRKSMGEAGQNLFLIWKEVPEKSGLDLICPIPKGKFRVLARWIFLQSTSDAAKHAIKGIQLTLPVEGETTIEGCLEHTAASIAIGTGEEQMEARIEMWKALPVEERKKEQNRICPCCGSRGSLYLGEYSNAHYSTDFAMVCGACSFEGPHLTSDYDAEEAFFERFDSIRNRELKKQFFQSAIQFEMAGIEKHVSALIRISKSKKAYYTNADVEKITKQYEEIGRAIQQMQKNPKK